MTENNVILQKLLSLAIQALFVFLTPNLYRIRLEVENIVIAIHFDERFVIKQ